MIRSGISLLHEAMQYVWRHKSLIGIPILFWSICLGMILILAPLLAGIYYIIINLFLSNVSLSILTFLTIIWLPIMRAYMLGFIWYFIKLARHESPQVFDSLHHGWQSLWQAPWYLLFIIFFTIVKQIIFFAGASKFTLFLVQFLTLSSVIIFFFLPYLIVDGIKDCIPTFRASINHFKNGWKPLCGIVAFSMIYGLGACIIIGIITAINIGLALLLLGLPIIPQSFLPASLLPVIYYICSLGILLFPILLFIFTSMQLALAWLYTELNEEDVLPEFYSAP